MFTIAMFVALIALYVVMFGLVKFSEKVIATPQLAPLAGGTAPSTVDSAKSL